MQGRQTLGKTKDPQTTSLMILGGQNTHNIKLFMSWSGSAKTGRIGDANSNNTRTPNLIKEEKGERAPQHKVRGGELFEKETIFFKP